MVRDLSRDRLPRGACWNLLDVIPGELGAPAAKRGGWSYATTDLSAVHAGADRVLSVAYAPFLSGGQIVAITKDEAGQTRRCVVYITSANDKGATGVSVDEYYPVFYRNILWFFTGSTMLQYDGTNLNTVAGGPGVNVGCAYKDRLVGGRTGGQPQRLFFSEAGDGTTWNTGTRYIDTTGEVTGLWALRNSIIVFHHGSIERIVGSIPPPDSDMYLQTVSGNVGAENPWSQAGTDEFVAFANAGGAYLTDGSVVADLTLDGGIKSYWQSQTAAVGSLLLIGGYYRGYYFVVIRDGGGSGSFVDCLACHIRTRRWLRFSNITASMFARRVSGKEELYFGDIGEPRVNAMSDCFNPSASNKNDADGTVVTPVVETAFWPLGRSKARLKSVYVKYDVRDAASDNPTLAASYVTSPEATSYTSISGTLAETAEQTVARRNIRKAGFGLALKLAQSGASSASRFYEISVDAHPREDSRVA